MDPGEAFVIWLEPSVDGAPLQGEVEHTGSAVRERFADADTLLAFLSRYASPKDAGTGHG